MANVHTANGFPGLVLAGVGTLESDAEIRELMDRIVQHGEVLDLPPILKDVDMHEFFKTAIERRCDFLKSGSTEALAAELKRKN
jgi:hypothetical protein